MNALHLAGLLFLGVVFCRNIADKPDDANKVDTSNEELFTLDLSDVNSVTKKCIEVGGEAAGKKFTTTLQSAVSCLNNQIPKNTEELKNEINSEELDTFICSKRRKALRGCFVELVDALKDCSVEEEKYAPEFFFDALDNLLDFVCEDNGKIIKDLIKSNNTWECAETLVDKLLVGNLTTVCTDNFKLIHDNEDKIVTKQELCEDLGSAKTCYTDVVNRECPDAKEVNVWLVGLFDALSLPCNSAKVIKRHLQQFNLL